MRLGVSLAGFAVAAETTSVAGQIMAAAVPVGGPTPEGMA
jgi:hypothetical protein